jgi:Xaa-Pro aminopeptidase
MAYRILGLDPKSLTTRRWFYWVPASGEPVKLAHKVEPAKLDRLPGRQEHYLAWRELHEKLQSVLGRGGKIAMQYSPMNQIPLVSVVDAGTVELVRSFGHEVVTSADLVQTFEAVTDEAGLQSHVWAGERVQRIKDEVFAKLDRGLQFGDRLTEYEVMRFILDRFEEEGLTSDEEIPIVGFNDHPADPHFEPTKENAYALHHGDTILVDLWARRKEPVGYYYDITWCAFAASSRRLCTWRSSAWCARPGTPPWTSSGASSATGGPCTAGRSTRSAGAWWCRPATASISSTAPATASAPTCTGTASTSTTWRRGTTA